MLSLATSPSYPRWGLTLFTPRTLAEPGYPVKRIRLPSPEVNFQEVRHAAPRPPEHLCRRSRCTAWYNKTMPSALR